MWLQADNAGKEVRNASTGKWSCLLTQAGFFSQVSQCHLSVGHTHEDVGGPRSDSSFHRYGLCFTNRFQYGKLNLYLLSAIQMRRWLW